MSNVVITRKSWFSRLGDALKGILVGLVLLAIALGGLWWNEGRSVSTAKGLKEGAGLVISVPADSLDAANEGKLVHVSGPAVAGADLVDPDFPYMTVKGLILQRTVEMYQWKEEAKTQETKDVGGSTTQTTTYSYHRVWSGSLNDSMRFHDQAGHSNPRAMPYASLTLAAKDATLGAFKIPSAMLTLNATERVQPPQTIAEAGNLKSVRGQLYIGESPDSPAIGDVRITHSYAPQQDISVVAKQQAGAFAPFAVLGGERSIEILKPGLHDAATLFQQAEAENAMLTWLLRGGGLLACIIGFFLLLRPLAVVGDVIPFIGGIVGLGAGIVAFFLGLASSLLVVGLAWVYYRPLIGVPLLLCAIAALAAMLKMARKRAPAAGTPAAAEGVS